MKVITVPPGAQIEAQDQSGKTIQANYPYKRWLQEMLELCQPLARDPKLWGVGATLAKLIRESNGSITLETAEYDIVKAAIVDAAAKDVLKPIITRQIASYWASIENAEEAK